MIRMICCWQAKAANHHKYIGTCRHKHTQTNLNWRLGLFSFLAKPAEEGYADWCQRNNETRIELLEDRCIHCYYIARCLYVIIT